MVFLMHDSNTLKIKLFSVVFRVEFFSFCFSFVMGVRVYCLVSFLLVVVDFVRLFSTRKRAFDYCQYIFDIVCTKRFL